MAEARFQEESLRLQHKHDSEVKKVGSIYYLNVSFVFKCILYLNIFLYFICNCFNFEN